MNVGNIIIIPLFIHIKALINVCVVGAYSLFRALNRRVKIVTISFSFPHTRINFGQIPP